MVNLDVDLEDVKKAKEAGDKNLTNYGYWQTNSYATWEYVKWIKTITHLPIILKGVNSRKQITDLWLLSVLLSIKSEKT